MQRVLYNVILTHTHTHFHLISKWSEWVSVCVCLGACVNVYFLFSKNCFFFIVSCSVVVYKFAIARARAFARSRENSKSMCKVLCVNRQTVWQRRYRNGNTPTTRTKWYWAHVIAVIRNVYEIVKMVLLSPFCMYRCRMSSVSYVCFSSTLRAHRFVITRYKYKYRYKIPHGVWSIEIDGMRASQRIVWWIALRLVALHSDFTMPRCGVHYL